MSTPTTSGFSAAAFATASMNNRGFFSAINRPRKTTVFFPANPRPQGEQPDRPTWFASESESAAVGIQRIVGNEELLAGYPAFRCQ